MSGSAGATQEDLAAERIYAALEATDIDHGSFSVTRGGVQIGGKVNRGSKSSVIGATLAVFCDVAVTAATIEIRNETAYDRFGKRIKINREFTTGDAAFDHACYIDADVPDATLAALFRSPDVRAVVQRILATGGVDVIKIEPNASVGVEARYRRFATPGPLNAAVDELPKLKVAVEQAAADERQRREGGTYRDVPVDPHVETLTLPSQALRSQVLLVLDALGLATGFLVMPRLKPMCTLENSWATFPSAIVTALVVVVVNIALFRGRSSSLRSVTVFSVIGWLPAIYLVESLLTIANARLDHGPRRDVNGIIEAVSTQKNGTHYDAVVGDLSATMNTSTLPVAAATNTGIEHPVIFTIGSGYFGARWIESTRLKAL